LRRAHGLGSGQITWNESIADVLDFTVGDVRVVVNMSDDELPLPSSEVLLRSGPITETLPHDTTVWVRA